MEGPREPAQRIHLQHRNCVEHPTVPPYVVEVKRREGIALAVIRRQVRASELARVVPECCGLVWNAVRAQQARGGRHVSIYWDRSIRLEVGVELLGPFSEFGEV